MVPDELVRRSAGSRHGVITREEAHRCGLSDRQIRSRVANGAWRRHAAGVFTLAGVAPSDHQRLLVAALRTGGSASHGSAAWLHQIEDEAPTRPRVTRRSSGGHQHPSLKLHRSGDLVARDLITVDSIPVTTPVRTILDLAAVRSDDQLSALIERARVRRLIHPDRLIARHLEIARRGRPGAARARRVLIGLDPDLAAAESDLETMLWLLVERAGLPVPVRQHTVHVDGSTYRLDVAYPAQRLAVEGDGFTFHTERPVFESDRARQNELVLAGWCILRFTWRQITCRPEWVARQIRSALDRSDDLACARARTATDR